jgi:hypothetical protein
MLAVLASSIAAGVVAGAACYNRSTASAAAQRLPRQRHRPRRRPFRRCPWWWCKQQPLRRQMPAIRQAEATWGVPGDDFTAGEHTQGVWVILTAQGTPRIAWFHAYTCNVSLSKHEIKFLKRKNLRLRLHEELYLSYEYPRFQFHIFHIKTLWNSYEWCVSMHKLASHVKNQGFSYHLNVMHAGHTLRHTLFHSNSWMQVLRCIVTLSCSDSTAHKDVAAP